MRFPLPLYLPVLVLLGCVNTAGPVTPSGPQSNPETVPALTIFGRAALTVDWRDAEPVVELTPLRALAGAGDEYLLDLTNLLGMAPCADCVQATAISRLPGERGIAVEIAVRHPFGLPTAPGSRRDLHAFDLAGLLVRNAGPGDFIVFPPDGTRLRTRSMLLNADGYSAVFDANLDNWIQTPNADAHPYKVFTADVSAGNYNFANPNGFADVIAPSGHNVFAMGSTLAETFEIGLQPGDMTFATLVLTASHGRPDTGIGVDLGERENPIYYAPEFNQKAAWRVTLREQSNGLIAGDTSSSAVLVVGVRDWQQGAVVDPTWEFGATQLNQVKAASDIEEVALVVPGVGGAVSLVQPGSMGLGTGVYTDREFTFTLLNSEAAPASVYPGLVTVTDSLTLPVVVGLDRDLQPFALGPWVTYQYFTVTIP